MDRRDDRVVELLRLRRLARELLAEPRDLGGDLFGLDRAHGPRDAVPLVDRTQPGLQRALRHRLHARIQCRADGAAELIQPGFALLLDELLAHESDPLRRATELGERLIHDLDRRVDPLLGLRRRQLADRDELIEHVALALLRVDLALGDLRARPQRDQRDPELLGLLRKRREHRRFADVELADVLAEIEPRRLLDAVARVAEVDLVHVQRHDLLLAQRLLDPAREDDLLDLALERALRREQERLDDLLRDRRRAFLGVTGAQVRDERAHHADVVDAAVGPELVVLGRDERVDHDRRNLVVRNERAALVKQLADAAIVGVEDRDDLLGVVIAELLEVRQLRIAAVEPEHERDGRARDRGAGDAAR